MSDAAQQKLQSALRNEPGAAEREAKHTVIEMTDITKSYEMGVQVVHALRGVNLTIAAGEFVAIMGIL